MLVLSRLVHEKIIITVPGCKRIEITVCSIWPKGVKLGINAPLEFQVHREEVQQEIDREALANQ